MTMQLLIQNIISGAIVLGAFGYMGWRIYKIITKKPSPKGTCDGCDGCALKAKIDCAAPDIYKGNV
jgi:FeoB-associated Cys-rich membrane protein